MGIKFQTDVKKTIMYGRNTVYNSACGPSALCNALYAFGLADVSVTAMCDYSVSVGARVEGGTDMHKLLKAAAGKYGFTYRTTSKNVELLAHLRAGGVAILHQGNSYPVFANGGHFVLARSVSVDDMITVWDSYWTSTKYVKWPAHRAIRVGPKGVVTASIAQIGKATEDRSPSYYLISKNHTVKEQQEDEEVIYKKLSDVPEYYSGVVKLLMEHGSLKGTSDGEINLPESVCRELTILQREGVIQKKYRSLDEIPSYYKEAISELIDSGCLHGVSADNLNLTENDCRLLTIMLRREKLVK